MSEAPLQDAVIRQALQLQRLAAGDEARALEIMAELERELTALLSATNLDAATRREIEALVRDARQAIEGRYGLIGGVVDAQGIMVVVAENTVRVLAENLPSATVPTIERLNSLAKDVIIDGAPASAWWSRQAEDVAFRFAREVRHGVIEGSTPEQITARIVGRGDEPGILDAARRNVRALVHSSVMTAANRARLETFRKNAKHVGGVRWLATLDSHTCTTCAVLDGSTWDLEGQPTNGTTMAFQMPPAHFGCRCVASPVPKSLNDIFGTTGIDEAIAAGSRRASANGPVAARSFADFLENQPRAFVEQVLGVRRAELWRQGKITLRDLVSGSGRELTLEQLKQRIGE